MERVNTIYGSGVSSKSILIYNYMKGFENTGGCFASYNYMSKQLNLSRSSIIRAINELVSNGYLYKEYRYRNDGGKTSNNYILKKTV